MNLWHKLRRRGGAERSFANFVAYWDRLETLTIQVYRDQVDDGQAQAEFAAVWPWLRRAYPHWQNELAPHWRATRAAGAPTATDPFQLLLDLASPAAIDENWRAMQHLPAAREAINHYLLDR